MPSTGVLIGLTSRHLMGMAKRKLSSPVLFMAGARNYIFVPNAALLRPASVRSGRSSGRWRELSCRLALACTRR